MHKESRARRRAVGIYIFLVFRYEPASEEKPMETSMPSDAPATCTVRHSKLRLLGALAVLLVFAAVMTRFLPHLPRGDTGVVAMRVIMAFLLGLLLTFVLRYLFWIGPVVRVDETGIYDARGVYPLFAWDDVVAAEAWRTRGEESVIALRLTVRNPDKYQIWLEKLSPHGKASPGQAYIHLNFWGLTPGPEEVADCIRQHLARRGGTVPA